jgi:hypothetical protein
MNSQNEILKMIADNPLLSGALRELLEKQFNLPIEMRIDRSDELLGQITRARLAGLNAIDSAFKEIEQYKSILDEKEKVNPAR